MYALRRLAVVQCVAAAHVREEIVGSHTSTSVKTKVPDEDTFYEDTLSRLLRLGVLTRDMRVLVACGGVRDQEVLSRYGFTTITISNLDLRLSGNEFAPYSWSYQDVENLTVKDNEFDFTIVHNGLHHCYSPHKGLLELYRVARRGTLIFEPRDTLLDRYTLTSDPPPRD